VLLNGGVVFDEAGGFGTGHLSGGPDFLRAMYPGYDAWQAVHARLNASGVFDSPMSRRVGLCPKRFVP
jgi:hypothetical protein